MQNPSAAFIPFVTSPASAAMAQLIQNHPVVAEGQAVQGLQSKPCPTLRLPWTAG